MNKNKMDYTSPTCETLVVRFEGVICGSGDINAAMLFEEKADVQNGSSTIFW